MGLFRRNQGDTPPPAAIQDASASDAQATPPASNQDTGTGAGQETLARYAHQEKMQLLRMQQERDRREAAAARQQTRREARQRVAHSMRSWLYPEADEATLTPLERHRKRIESFEEDRETLPERVIRYLFLALAYVLPFLGALAIGKEIGDAYSGTTDFWVDGWSIGTHTVAYAGEFSLAMMVLSTAAAFRRYKADSSYTAKLVSSIFFFLLFIAASSLAQWFIAEQHIHPKNNADLAALIFRVVMPPAVDVASVLYLSIMGYKSLRKFLDEQQQKAAAIKLLNEAELTILGAQQEAERRQKEAEQYLAQKERRESLLLRIEEIHSQAMVETAQRVLLNPASAGPVQVREARSTQEHQGYVSQAEEREPAQIPLPSVRSAVVSPSGSLNGHAKPNGVYEKFTPGSESADGDASFRQQ